MYGTVLLTPKWSRQYSAPFPKQPQNGDLEAVPFLSPRPKGRGASRAEWPGAQILDSGNAEIEHCPYQGSTMRPQPVLSCLLLGLGFSVCTAG